MKGAGPRRFISSPTGFDSAFAAASCATFWESTSRQPETLRFDYTALGKPLLADEPSLAFNVSHTRGICLLAFSDCGDIGIDVEAISSRIDIGSLAEKYFHPHEWEALAALPPAARRTFFFACWTCKEAYLKATGLGLSEQMNAFEVVPPLPFPGDVSIHCTPRAQSPWWARVLDAGPDCAAAVARATRPESVELFDWQW